MDTSERPKANAEELTHTVLQAAAAAGLHRLAPARAAVKMRQSSRPAEGGVDAGQRLNHTPTKRACCS